MSNRAHMSPKKDHKVYTESARRIKKVNVAPKISRGGIRF